MDIAWFVAGVALVIVELMTGTLYLLVLGVAAIVAALFAWLGFALLPQVVAFGIVALVALLFVQQRRKKAPAAAPPLELGQSVTFENWVDPKAATARVRYRGTLWNARVAGDCEGAPGEILYITAVDGATLTIAKQA